MQNETQKGLLLGLSAFLIWGLAPIFFRQIEHIPSGEIIVHRIIWAFLILILTIRFWKHSNTAKLSTKQYGLLTAASVLVGSNWYIFVWAVNDGRILETSLGYFINPLLSLLLGVVLLSEKLSKAQALAAGLAVTGVVYQAIQLGSLPWVSLSLAGTFAFYGLIKKRLTIGAAQGMFVETTILLPIAIIGGLYLFTQDSHHFRLGSWTDNVYLIGAGLITLLPLVLFSAASKRIPLIWIGFMQYIAPSMTFAIAILIYDEPLDVNKLVTFGLIWLGLILITVEGYKKAKLRRKEMVKGSLS